MLQEVSSAEELLGVQGAADIDVEGGCTLVSFVILDQQAAELVGEHEQLVNAVVRL